MRPILVAIFMGLFLIGSPATSAQAQKISFPDTDDGAHVLPVDFHLHTVWSDGAVWPTIRVDEAMAEGLAAIAITDHIEALAYEKYFAKDESGLLDLNRSYAIAHNYAKGAGAVNVIQGAEITRGFGHFNCLYTQDNNALRVSGRGDDEFGRYLKTDAEDYQDTIRSITTATDQGAFCFWNHPHGQRLPGSGVALEPIHKELIASGKIKGIEVANGDTIFRDAIRTALDHGLTMFGNSDTHKTVALYSAASELQHRTVTLVLARDASEASMRQALENKQTVALYRNTLIGRPDQVSRVVRAALHVAAPGQKEGRVLIEIENRSSVPMALEFDEALIPFDQTNIVTIPAFGKQRISFFEAPDVRAGIKVTVLNSHVDALEKAVVVLPVTTAQ